MNNLESGKELGRYELLVPIAKGGMAQVWAARLLGTRGFTKLVAIKVILPGGMDNARLEQMFLEEASLAASIHHPNVVETLELGEHEGTLYLVMEWVEGESLHYVQNRALERGGVPLTVAVNLVGQACRGLHAAHELCGEDGRHLGIVHRDISPQNVLITYTGTAKIVDFGIAKATGRASTLTEAGEIKGKVAYMSPEQVRGAPLDRRSDLFALGILLFSLTTGTHPFKGTNPGETVKRIVCGEPIGLPSELVPDYPKALEAVVMKALCEEAEKRFSSAEEMLAALEDALPKCLDSSAANQVKQYLHELLGDRARERRGALRLAQEALGIGKTPQTFSALMALSVDRPSDTSSKSNRSLLQTPPAMESTIPPAALGIDSRRKLVVAGVGGVAFLGVVGLGILVGASDQPTVKHSAASPVVPTAAPTVTASVSAIAAAAASQTAAPAESSAPDQAPSSKGKRAGRARVAGPGASPSARPPSSSSGSASSRPSAAKPSADAWDPTSFGSRH
jgi:serine/threonine protein kinase